MPALDPLKSDSPGPPKTLSPSSQCNLCGSAEYEVLSKIGRGNESLNTVICKKCGLVWSHPFPLEPLIYYQKHYRIRYKGTYTPRKKHIFRSARAAMIRFDMLKHLLQPRWRVLEVGSGGGEFLYLMKKLGLDAFGVEPNEGYAEYSKNEYQLDIKNGFLQNTEFEENSFDMVTLWHVLEHMDNPTDCLKKIHSFMATGGLLVIEVPNVESVCSTPNNTFHAAHLYNFNRSTLRRMVERVGFVLVEESMEEDGGNFFQFFKKNGAAPREIHSEIDGNYEQVKNIVTRRTTLKYYFSRYPYVRVVRKILQWVRERGATNRYAGGKEILGHLMDKIDQNSLPRN